jgi:hypothetical protein
MANMPNTRRAEAARCSRPAQRTNSITRCFIAMRKSGLNFSARRASGVILPMIAALISLTTAPQIGLAQSPCPTSFLPPGCSWGTSTSTNVTAGGCTVTIDYCTICCSGTNYFYVYEMSPISGEGCDYVDPQLYENAAASALINAVACSSPCPNGSTVTTVAFPTCWVKNGISGEYTFSGCGTASCYCLLSATVTCTNGVISLSGCTSTSVGTGCESCTPDPGPSRLWISGTCYALSCPPPPC